MPRRREPVVFVFGAGKAGTALARALPAGTVVQFARGCHTDPFFTEQEPPSLAFLARHLAA